ncbi:MAG: VTT domain-containing protein [Myxococcota bacterium]
MEDEPGVEPSAPADDVVRRRRRVQIAFVVVLGLIGVILYRTGALSYLTRDNLSRWATEAGPYGPGLYIALYVGTELINVPSMLMVVVAGLIWPLHIAIPTAYAGSLAAGSIVFSIARVIIRGAFGDVLRKKMPAALEKYDEALATRGIRTVALIRFLTFLSPVMHWVLAASRVSFRDMFIGSAVGLLPGVVMLVVGGDAAFRYWDIVRPYLLVAIIIVIAVQIVRSLRKPKRSDDGTT